jgi:hypothetical protein
MKKMVETRTTHCPNLFLSLQRGGILEKFSAYFNLIKGRFPVPWGVRSAKQGCFILRPLADGVVDSLNAL